MIKAQISKKSDIVRGVAKKARHTQVATECILNAFIEYLNENFAMGNSIYIHDLGTLELRDRKAKTTKNPLKPGELLNIPALRTVGFRPSEKVKSSARKSMGLS